MEKEKKKLSLKEIGPSRLVIMLLAGIFLLVLSFPDLFSSDKTSDTSGNTAKTISVSDVVNQEDQAETDTYAKLMEERLENILAKVKGIGAVDVMITLKASKELIVLKDQPYTQESMNESDGEGGNRVSSGIDKEDSTVIVDDGSGESLPFIIQELEPEVAGIVVIAGGGDNPVIMTEIVDAVQVLFNVPAHKVKVMKMNE
jgi:stage III sporulation protein AG